MLWIKQNNEIQEIWKQQIGRVLVQWLDAISVNWVST